MVAEQPLSASACHFFGGPILLGLKKPVFFYPTNIKKICFKKQLELRIRILEEDRVQFQVMSCNQSSSPVPGWCHHLPGSCAITRIFWFCSEGWCQEGWGKGFWTPWSTGWLMVLSGQRIWSRSTHFAPVTAGQCCSPCGGRCKSSVARGGAAWEAGFARGCMWMLF